MAKRVNPNDFIGKKIGHLTIVRFISHNNRHPFYEFQCDCGRVVTRRISDVMRQHEKTCRDTLCEYTLNPKNPNPNKHIGEKIGHLTAINYLGQNKNKYHIYEYKCDCGNTITESRRDILQIDNPACDKPDCTCATRFSLTMKRRILRREHKDLDCVPVNQIIIENPSILPGMQFGLLTVKDTLGENISRCQCSCGREVNVKNEDLLSKKRVSCMNEFCKHNPRGFKKYEAQVNLLAYYQM